MNKRLQPNIYYIIKSFIKIIDSVTPILTLGFYWTNLEYKYCKWYTFKTK